MSHETDNQAWTMENAAYQMSSESAAFARKCARDLRESTLHGEIVELFKRGDEQNKIIDIGLQHGPLPIIGKEGTK